MDDLTRRIANYAAHARFEDVPEDIVRAATRLVVDSLACAVAAYGSEAAEIGRRLARGAVPERYPGRMLESGERTTAEAAAFVNTCLIRCLDFNDQYPSGHPSDCLGALFALAGAAGADGRRLLASMIVAYETYIRLNDPTTLRDMGWDQGFIVGISTAAGVGNLLGLSAEAIGEAVAITAVANVPMRNTRAGKLSLWKGAATAYAVRNGVFGALLAAEGMTGPDRPFEGHDGLWELLTGPFTVAPFPATSLSPLTNEGGTFRIPDVNMKYWPVEYNAQLVVWAGLQLRERLDWRDLAEIDVGIYSFAISEIAGDEEKWDPKTRETADHSLPYILARTLVDGKIDAATFEESAFLDPSLRPLMAKIRVHKDDAIEASYPVTIALNVEARTSDGGRHLLELRDPLGHEANPMRDDDVRAKFLRAAEPVLGPARAVAAIERWWDLAHMNDVTAALELLDL